MQNVLSLIEQIGFETAEDGDIVEYLSSLKAGQDNPKLRDDGKHKLNSMLAKYSLQENIFLLDSNGMCVADALEKLEGKDLSSMDYFVEPRKT